MACVSPSNHIQVIHAPVQEVYCCIVYKCCTYERSELKKGSQVSIQTMLVEYSVWQIPEFFSLDDSIFGNSSPAADDKRVMQVPPCNQEERFHGEIVLPLILILAALQLKKACLELMQVFHGRVLVLVWMVLYFNVAINWTSSCFANVEWNCKFISLHFNSN